MTDHALTPAIHAAEVRLNAGAELQDRALRRLYADMGYRVPAPTPCCDVREAGEAISDWTDGGPQS